MVKRSFEVMAIKVEPWTSNIKTTWYCFVNMRVSQVKSEARQAYMEGGVKQKKEADHPTLVDVSLSQWPQNKQILISTCQNLMSLYRELNWVQIHSIQMVSTTPYLLKAMF